MSSANSNEPDQKISSDAFDSGASNEKPKAVPPTFTATSEETKVLNELLNWPPKNYKDEFTKPPFWKFVAHNHVQEAICLLNSAPTMELAKDPKYQDSKEIAVFFSYRKHEALPEPGKVNMQDWFVFEAKELPGSAKKILMHRAFARLVSKTIELHGKVVLKMHPVPHPTQHSVFTVKDIYVLPAGSEAETIQTIKNKFCFMCNAGSALGTCKCEKVNFCSQLCRDRAVQSQRHTEEQCTKLMTESVFGTMKDIRLVYNEFKESLDKNVKQAAASSKADAEKLAGALERLDAENPKKNSQEEGGEKKESAKVESVNE